MIDIMIYLSLVLLNSAAVDRNWTVSVQFDWHNIVKGSQLNNTEKDAKHL